ncbi:putative ribosomal large subunit pseudouridine synthase SVR1, chloroplastic [Typha angustifolia]|uniref:putative ribosomal large subunit pseudouridine synthase SVR1, chloroplastic n=1 Tax=Typha angustifolia TaxID=59011 RepID=UPI003C2DB3A3
MAMAVAFSSIQTFPSLFSNQTLRFQPLRRRLPLFLASSSSSSTTEFNISFGTATSPRPSKTLVPDASPPDPSSASLPIIPWIVRDENGNLTIQSSPPARFLQSMAETKTSSSNSKKKKKIDNSKSKEKNTPPTPVASTAPKYSKAARRFYNQNIKESQVQRLSKVLAAAGVASRRSSEELIFEGKVTVNGSVCTSPQTRVDISKDSIYVNGSRLSKKLPPKLYFALNKPKGYICSSGDESKSVISLFDELWKGWNKIHPRIPKPRLFTVGRLDVATTGLIIVTNDGEFAQTLAHPSSELSKEYIATVDGTVHRRHLIAISEGTEIEGIKCVPDSVELLPVQPDASRPRLRIVVHEGRNHEVRELVKNAGLQLYSLKRIRIGGFRLPSDLGLGKYVELKPADIRLLQGNSRKSA